MSIDKRSYAKVERSTWRNETFRRKFSDDAQWVWMYILTTNREAGTPGLIEATPLNIMEDLGWDWRGLPEDMPQHERVMHGVKRTVAALDEIANTRHSSGNPWIEYSERERLIVVPRAILHNPPANPNVMAHWMKNLCEHPDSKMKQKWLSYAFLFITKMFGSNNSKTNNFVSLCARSGYQFQSDGVVIFSQPSVIIDDDETVSKKTLPLFSNKVEITNTNTNTNTNTKEEGDNPNAGPRLLGPPAIPPNFTQRQRDFLKLFLETEIYVREHGEMKIADALKDPVRLAAVLGNENLYPAVDTAFIGRLAAWTFENKERAKKDIGRFLMNNASREQERGGMYRMKNRGAVQAQESPASANHIYGDLSAKNRKSGDND